MNRSSNLRGFGSERILGQEAPAQAFLAQPERIVLGPSTHSVLALPLGFRPSSRSGRSIAADRSCFVRATRRQSAQRGGCNLRSIDARNGVLAEGCPAARDAAPAGVSPLPAAGSRTGAEGLRRSHRGPWACARSRAIGATTGRASRAWVGPTPALGEVRTGLPKPRPPHARRPRQSPRSGTFGAATPRRRGPLGARGVLGRGKTPEHVRKQRNPHASLTMSYVRAREERGSCRACPV